MPLKSASKRCAGRPITRWEDSISELGGGHWMKAVLVVDVASTSVIAGIAMFLFVIDRPPEHGFVNSIVK